MTKHWIIPCGAALALCALPACKSHSEKPETVAHSVADAGEITLAVTGMT